MVNIEKHVSYWRNSAEEDFEVAKQLIDSDKIRHGLFFLHLTLEKIIKSHVSLSTGDIAPRIHNLVRLAELSGISFQKERIEFLAEMNPFNIEGRYPEVWGVLPSRQEAEILIQKTKELFLWLKNQSLHPQENI
jgi:HEPN domain-containing protein